MHTTETIQTNEQRSTMQIATKNKEGCGRFAKRTATTYLWWAHWCSVILSNVDGEVFLRHKQRSENGVLEMIAIKNQSRVLSRHNAKWCTSLLPPKTLTHGTNDTVVYIMYVLWVVVKKRGSLPVLFRVLFFMTDCRSYFDTLDHEDRKSVV